MSSKKQTKAKVVTPVEEKVEETKETLPVEEKADIPEKCEECTEECKGAEECKKDETEETPNVPEVDEGVAEPVEEKIDPLVAMMLNLNRKNKVREHVKQAGIYSAMSGIVAVESVNE